jgi:membrane fusion protein, copper/silver efflux system
MRLRGCLLGAMLLGAACANPRQETATLGDLRIAMGVEPDPPRAGENKLLLTISDPSGRPVEDARITFQYDMAAMGSMPEMKGGGDVKALPGGRYQVDYALAMNGDWSIKVGVDAPARAHQTIGLRISPPHQGFSLEGAAGEREGAAGAGAIQVSAARQQLIGATFATVEERPLTIRLRAVGRVDVDERRLGDVTLKYEAYVERLLVSETGREVRAGQALASLYSPDLLAAEEEYLGAKRGAGAMPQLAVASERRLANWDLSPKQISVLERQGHADGRVTIVAPIGGVVLEKNVVSGAHLMPGTSLYRIGNLGRVWVQAAISERDATFVSVGQPASVTLPSRPGEKVPARVTFVAPTVDDKTRTVAARLELLNPRLFLRPGMLADVELEVPLGVKLAVPDAALLLSGEHRYVFVDRGGGQLRPTQVEVGALTGAWDEVRSGLRRGDRVATGATFLLSSEAKLRDALPRWNEAP